MNKSSSLLRLLQLADPALPVGGFAHSAGMETYVQSGMVNNPETAGTFIINQLSQNIFYTDAAFVSLAYDAAKLGDWNSIRQLDTECTAVKLPREMREASQKLGLRLLKIFDAVCSHETGRSYRESIHQKDCAGHYSIVFGIYSAAMSIPKQDALSGFYYNVAAGMVTNSVKLIPLGQQDGQLLLFSLQTLIQTLVERSMVPDRKRIGFSCAGFDIRSMQHEQLYSRLYMS